MGAWGKGGKGGKGNAPAVQYSAAIVARVAHNLMDAISLPCWSASLPLEVRYLLLCLLVSFSEV